MKNFVRLALAIVIGFSVAACAGIPDSNEKDAAEAAREAVIENIMSRRSVRKFTDERVSKAVLDTIIMCGINAPNAKNQQAYEVKVVDDPVATAYLSENLHGLYKAPVYLFFANDTRFKSSLIDVGLLSENICLSAWAYGIGTVNLGFPARDLSQKPEILDKFGFSENYEICLVVALGYPDEAPDAKPRNSEKVQFVKF